MISRVAILVLASVITVVVGFTTPLQANIIDHGIYLEDTVSGLDWLDVTETMEGTENLATAHCIPYNTISSQLGAGGVFAGWRYATGEEFNALLEHYTGTAPGTYSRVLQNDKITGLIALLGPTYINAGAYQAVSGMLVDESELTFGYRWSAALLDDFDNYNLVGGDYSQTHFIDIDPSGQYLALGSFLVRTHTDVPEPSTLLLMALGLLGLGTFCIQRISSRANFRGREHNGTYFKISI